MKAYNQYMDNISVSDTLHHRFISHTANARPARRPAMIRRYATAFACLAVILLGAVAIPQLMQSNTPGNTPSVSQPGVSAPLPGEAGKYALIFNKADSLRSADSAYISGHFWQELTSDELKKVFPGLTDTYAVTATANFQGDGTLLNIEANAVSVNGCASYIQAAPGKVLLDYVLNGRVKISDVLGTAVTAGYFETKPNSKGQRNIIYFASFKIANLDYYVELGGAETKKEELQKEISGLIGLLIKGGAADLSAFDNPTIPELREDALDLNEARADADFGPYMPASMPSGFAFESAMRFINQKQNYLSALWVKGMGSIHWRISALGEDDKARITSVTDRQNYDLSLYRIPRADSVPDGLREMVNDPIFHSEDLTLDVVRTRTYEVSDAGDEPGCRMRFGVLYGDTLVKLNVKGATPESVLEMLQQIKK